MARMVAHRERRPVGSVFRGRDARDDAPGGPVCDASSERQQHSGARHGRGPCVGRRRAVGSHRGRCRGDAGGVDSVQDTARHHRKHGALAHRHRLDRQPSRARAEPRRRSRCVLRGLGARVPVGHLRAAAGAAHHVADARRQHRGHGVYHRVNPSSLPEHAPVAGRTAPADVAPRGARRHVAVLRILHRPVHRARSCNHEGAKSTHATEPTYAAHRERHFSVRRLVPRPLCRDSASRHQTPPRSKM